MNSNFSKKITRRWLKYLMLVLILSGLGTASNSPFLFLFPTTQAQEASSGGSLLAWGDNTGGQLGIGSSDNSAIPIPITVSSLVDVKAQAIAAGENYSVVIGSDGKLYAWGNSHFGRAGLSLAPGVQAQTISANGYNILAIGSDGNVYDLNQASVNNTTPVVVSLPTGVKAQAIATGTRHSLVIGSDGKLYAWGDNSDGQLGNNTFTDSSTPIVVNLPAGVKAQTIAAGYAYSMAIGTDGKVYAWGNNYSGELGNGSTNNSKIPTVVSLPAGVKAQAIAAGSEHSLAIGSDGKLYGWGRSYDPATSYNKTPIVVSLPAGVQVQTIAAGNYHSLATGSDGKLYAWGTAEKGQLGNGTENYYGPTPVVVSLPAGVKAQTIAAGSYHSLAIGSDGKLYAWGDNSDGQLGNGLNAKTHSVPVVVNLPAGVKAQAIAAGDGHNLAIGSDGKLYAWGNNGYGQLGNGATTDSATPVAVSLAAGVTPIAVAAGDGHSLAIGSDGKLYAWGLNDAGQLGNGTTTNSNVPLVVSLPAGVKAQAIAAGIRYTLAIGSDGKLYTWGFNKFGQLGNGATTNSATPVAVSLAAGVTPTAIAAGDYHSLAIGSDGKLYAWGLNDAGELGNGTSSPDEPNATPLVVSLPAGVKAQTIAAGWLHSLAIGSDGKLYAWGRNNEGQLGNGTYNNSATPVAVSLAAGVTPTAIAAGQGHSLAIGSDGKLYAWGWNFIGQLDDPALRYTNTPTIISSLAAIKTEAIVAGQNYSLAITSSAPFDPSFLAVWQHTDQQIATGQLSRSWLWGPAPFTDRLTEDYVEAPGGKRLVQYFDKSRMELTNPYGDKTSPYYVTNGLLANELITGQLQVGNNQFIPKAPAVLNVAGDSDDTSGPTYQALGQVFNKPVFTSQLGLEVSTSIDRQGKVIANPENLGHKYGVFYAYYEPGTKHNIAAPFWTYLNQTGLVFNPFTNQVLSARLFEPVFYATGLPTTEAYWARVKVGGQMQDVLIQAFERRVLTFTPANPAAYQVEMGNIGWHYYLWRYNSSS